MPAAQANQLARKAFNPDTLAKRWDVSATTVRNMCADGRLAHFRIGKQYRIPVSVVEEYEGCQTSQSADSEVDTAFHGGMEANDAGISLGHASERKRRPKDVIEMSEKRPAAAV